MEVSSQEQYGHFIKNPSYITVVPLATAIFPRRRSATAPYFYVAKRDRGKYSGL